MTEKYVLKVDIDHETGEEDCTVLKTDGTNNMTNWIEIFSAMYTHHSILEPLVDELNKIQNNYDNTEKYAIKLLKENEQLKADNNRLVNETARIVAEHQGRILDLIDEKIKHYQKQPLLAVRIPNCEHRKSCMYNQEINVCNKAKENAYRELKKELSE